MGSLPDLQRDRLAFVSQMAAQYGDIVSYRIGPTRLFQVNHPEGVQHILQRNHANYTKDTRAIGLVRLIGGNGLFTSEGDFWLRQRRLMQPGFHRQRLAGFAGLMTDAAEQMGKNWAAAVQAGRPVSVAQDMVQLTLGVVVKALFSTDISADALAISEALTFLLGDITFRFDRMWYPPPSVPTPHNRQFRRALRALDESVYRIIRDRKEGRSGGADLLAMLMEAADEETGARMSDAQLRDEVVTIMVAGHETTANALHVGLAPAFGESGSRRPDCTRRWMQCRATDRLVEDLARLSYTRMVFEETLRLYPPVWLFDRKAIADDEICGYRVRAGDTVILSPYVTHRLPEFWEAPNQFEPERFEPGQVNRRIRYAYFPFGGGPRQCIGNNFALMEGTLVLATLARRFRLRPVAGHSVVPRPLAALRPSELVMRPEARS